MLKNYLTVAIRNLLKRKIYSFINIAGLSVGLAAQLLFLSFYSSPMSYRMINFTKMLKIFTGLRG